MQRANTAGLVFFSRHFSMSETILLCRGKIGFHLKRRVKWGAKTVSVGFRHEESSTNPCTQKMIETLCLSVILAFVATEYAPSVRVSFCLPDFCSVFPLLNLVVLFLSELNGGAFVFFVHSGKGCHVPSGRPPACGHSEALRGLLAQLPTPQNEAEQPKVGHCLAVAARPHTARESSGP